MKRAESREGREGWSDLEVEESMDQSVFLARAAEQARTRGLTDFLIVDADFHQYEYQAWEEILEHIEDPILRHSLRNGPPGSSSWIPGRVDTSGHQEVARRILAASSRLQSPGAHGAEREVALIRQAMDLMAIDYSFVFPTPMLHLGTNPLVDIEVALARAYAGWMTQRVLPAEPRIRTMLYLPFNDPEASYRLVEDFGDCPGVDGFMVTSVRYQPVHDNAYAKLYHSLEERGLPLGFHSAFHALERPLERMEKFIAVHSLGFPLYNMIHMTNWVLHGMPERHPRLKLVWIEGGLAWISFLMQRLDHEFMRRTSETPLLERKPSEYMREMYYTSQPLEMEHSEALRLTFELIDAENRLLYASDWPHWDFDPPSAVYDLPFLDESAKRKILGENARSLFKLPHRPGASP